MTEINTVRTDGFSMEYLRFGCGELPFVILPGLSVESVMHFADAVTEAYAPLAEAFTVYLFDPRKELPEACSVFDMARDAAAAVRALGLSRICLFGVSMGGMASLVFASEHPETVETLLLGSAAARVDEEHARLFERWIRLAEKGDAEGLYLAFGEAVYPRAFFESSREAFIAAAKSVTSADLRRFATLAEGVRTFDCTDRLSRIACPTLILGAGDDAVLGPDAARQIESGLTGCTVRECFQYDGYGHAAYDMAPDYKERLLRFALRQG